MNSPNGPSSGRIYFFLLLTTIFWGGSFLFTKLGVRDTPPQLFVLIRFTLATMIMLAAFGNRLRALNRDIVKRGIIIGGALGITNLCFVFGIQGTSISRAGVLNNLFVLFIPIITKLMWRDRIGKINLAGILLASAGIWMLASGGGEGFNKGDFISTICAFLIACHIVTVSKVLKDDDVYLITLIQLATVTIMAAAATIIMPLPPFTMTTTAYLTILYCAVFPTVICFTIQNIYQRYVTPTRAGLIYTLDPVWSILAGFLVLGERLSDREWAGCSLIFLAVLLPLLFKTFLEWRLRKMYLVPDGQNQCG